MRHQYFVYILASRYRGATYTGVTNDIYARLIEHRDPNSEGYAAKWNASKLVYLEEFQYINDAIAYEKKLKKWKQKWKQKWKWDLIEKNNFDWLDLSENYQLD